MTAVEIEGEVAGFVAESFLPEGAEPPRPDDELFSLLDSLQVLRLVVWVEERFGVKVADADLTAGNFSSVGRVAGFVASRGAC
jgi:acyl carrier protein